jgi:hypothetical protein
VSESRDPSPEGGEESSTSGRHATSARPRVVVTLRAAFVLFHGLAIVVLSLPSGNVSKARWSSKGTQADLAEWGQELGADGDFAERFRAFAEGYARVRGAAATPFAQYADVTGARQGWAMFSSPQRHPAELHVDLWRDGQWEPLWRPHDDAAAWNRSFFENHRLRKFQGRFAREWKGQRFAEFADFVGRRALVDHPEAARARVRLLRKKSLPPDAVARGERPKGTYETSVVIER